jgi:hypothetical protein
MPASRFGRLVHLSLVCLILAACGKVGPPVAPELRAPAVVAELAAMARTDGVELRWTNPVRRVDGSRLPDLTAVRIFRTDDTGVGDPRPAIVSHGRVNGYTEIGTIRLEPPTRGQERRMTLVDRRDLAFGHRYTYVVLAEDSVNRLGPPSRRVSVRFLAPPEAPQRFVAEAGKGEVLLEWDPPEHLVDGGELSGDVTYEVLRAPDATAPLEPVPGGRVEDPSFVDTGLESGRPYHYAVRAIRTEEGSTSVGPATLREQVTPLALTPPSPPTALVATAAAGSVRLAWQASHDPDVGRYIVRRAPPGGDFEQIGSTRAPSTVFVDRDVPRGRYRYVVTAEDSSTRRNESASSNEVTVAVP